MLFGAILWFLMETVFRPIAGVGPFGSEFGDLTVTILIPLAVHLLYGGILGSLAGEAKKAPERGPWNSETHPQTH